MESVVCKPHRNAMEYSYLNQVRVINVADKVMHSLCSDILLITYAVLGKVFLASGERCEE